MKRTFEAIVDQSVTVMTVASVRGLDRKTVRSDTEASTFPAGLYSGMSWKSRTILSDDERDLFEAALCATDSPAESIEFVAGPFFLKTAGQTVHITLFGSSEGQSGCRRLIAEALTKGTLKKPIILSDGSSVSGGVQESEHVQ
jgi:hypothetical protein